MVTVSLLLNVLVLVPVTWGLLRDATGMSEPFGPDSPARRILVSVYLAILAVSLVLLLIPEGARAALVPGLLAMQVVYKLITVPLVGLRNPVVMTNLAIVAVHAATLRSLFA